MIKFKLSRLWYIALLWIWLLLGAHLFYNYIDFSSQKVADKWWTLFQATLHKPIYLPYLSFEPRDRYIQKILFRWCLRPEVEDIHIVFKEDLCEVKTKDYKTFLIKAKPDINWSDDVVFGYKDLLFTYQDIIQKNIWQIPQLNNFDKIKVSRITGTETIKVEFPSASIDNQILFGFPILPHHILQDVSKQTYITMMNSNLITTSCAQIKQDTQDPNSLVINVEWCPDRGINFVQFKNFDSLQDLIAYIQKHKNTEYVDFFLSRKKVDGFDTQDSIINTFYIMFFNTKGKLDYKGRQLIWGLLDKYFFTGNNTFLSSWDINYLIKDHFIFNQIPQTDIAQIQQYLSGNLSARVPAPIQPTTTGKQTQTGTQTQLITINNNPFVIKDLQQTYYLPQIPAKQTIKIYLPQSGDKLTISANWWAVYAPKSFEKDNFVYNLSPNFGNIKQGKNVYKINLSKWGQQQTFTLIIWAGQKPSRASSQPQPKQPATTKPKLIQIKKKIKIVYLQEDTSQIIINKLQELENKLGITGYFEYIPLSGQQELMNILSWGDFDMVLTPLKMGLKKDISPLLISTNPKINPSQYSNATLASLVNQYWISSPKNQQEILQEINKIYEREMPFVILGKQIIQFQVNNKTQIQIPFRLYDLSLLVNYISKIKLIYKPQIDYQKLKDFQNFVNFIYQAIFP